VKRLLHDLTAIAIAIGIICLADVAGAATIVVPSGGNLQAALDVAQPGDRIELQAGATFTGPFILRNVGDGPEILIRTTTSDADLPPAHRVGPADVSRLARLISSDSGTVLRSEGPAGPYRLVGLEIAPAAGVELIDAVRLGTGTETTLDQLPHDITFDRVYIHGDPVVGSRRGIAMNGVNIRVFNSYISDFKQTCCDSQAVATWNGPGPFTIVNNYLEAAGENVMFGGGDPSIAGLVPSDIRIRNNHLAKPLRWKPDDASYEGTNWVIKNLFELKNAKNVVVDGNTFEYNWADDQNGFAILFTPRNQDGASAWSMVEGVLFTNNVIRHTLSGINILGWDNVNPSQQARNIVIRNNAFWDIGGLQWGEGSSQAYGYGQGGWFLQLLDGTAGVVIEHNAILETKGILVAGTASPAGLHAGEPHTGFVFRHNIVRHGSLGTGPPASILDYETIAAHFAASVIFGNLLIGGPDLPYPPGHVRVATDADVGFVDAASGDLRLASTSPFKGQAADGFDVGYDALAFESEGRAFTDATLTAGAHQIRAVHVSELRRRINDLRGQHGVAAAMWTDPVLSSAVTVKAAHINEMRTALEAVYAALGRSSPGYSDPVLDAGATSIKAAHIAELRAALGVLE
jgi:hypothetical protein